MCLVLLPKGEDVRGKNRGQRPGWSQVWLRPLWGVEIASLCHSSTGAQGPRDWLPATHVCAQSHRTLETHLLTPSSGAHSWVQKEKASFTGTRRAYGQDHPTLKATRVLLLPWTLRAPLKMSPDPFETCSCPFWLSVP